MGIESINLGGSQPLTPTAQNVSYSGNVAGATNVKAALDALAQGNVTLLPFKLAILGDSIATYAQGLWEPFLKSRFGANVIVNYAQGQAKYAHDTGTIYYTGTTGLQGNGEHKKDNNISNQVNRLVAAIEGGTIEQPDIVIIHAGVNDNMPTDSSWEDDADTSMYGDVNDLFQPLKAADEDLTGVDSSLYTTSGGLIYDKRGNMMDFAKAVEVGIIHAYAENGATVDDRLKTMVGGMRFAIETLWLNYPGIKVVVTTPIQSATTTYCYKVRHIAKVIREAASYLSVPVIDLLAESQINMYRYSWQSQSNDGLHPDLRGAMYMAECIGAGLIRHFGFVAPLNKYDNTLTVNVKDGSNNPVAGYNIDISLYGYDTILPWDAVKDGESDAWKSQYISNGKVVTDANGQVVLNIPAAKYVVKHRIWSGSTIVGLTTLGTADLTNGDATLNYTTT